MFLFHNRKPTHIFQLCILLGVLFPSLLLAEERIQEFYSIIRVETSGDLLVTERIRVNVEGKNIRRGIYRDFPTSYSDNRGIRRKVGFNVLSVTRNGEPEPYTKEFTMGGFGDVSGTRVRIGDADHYLSHAEHVYEITYRTSHQLGFYDDFDELYWNVTGNGWEFPIDQAVAFVELPVGAGGQVKEVAGYTGAVGSKTQNFSYRYEGSDELLLYTTSPLGKKEGFTIVVSFPKGFVEEPTQAEKVTRLFQDNLGLFIGFLGLLIVAAYYYWVWGQVGRDPEKGTIIPFFEAPENFSAADVRYLWKMRFDNKVFSAAILRMAALGAVRIEKEGSKFRLEKTGANEEKLDGEEKRALQKLFPKGYSDSLVLEQSNNRKIRGAIAALREALDSQHLKRHFVKNRRHFFYGVLGSLGAIVAAVVALPLERLPIAAFLSVWLSIWSFGVFFLGRQVFTTWRAAITGKVLMFFPALFITAFSIPFFIGEAVGLTFLISIAGPGYAVVLVGMVALNWLFFELLKAPTIQGRRLMDRIEGFKMYLETAERDRLQGYALPDMNQEVFEKFLPYAVALDVEQKWSEKFAAALEAAGQNPADSAHHPRYFPHGTTGSIAGVASTMTSSFSSALSSASRSSSSGSGGGGFSGGGGGGGGGGGW